MRLPCLLRTLGLAIVVAAGCGGDRPGDSTSTTPPAGSAGSDAALDPCTLVTRAEADQALGAASTPERPGEANIPPRLLTCRYTAPRGQGLAVMTVMVRAGYSDAEAKTTFQGMREVGPTQPVAGLGDDAFWLADQLWILKGTRSISVSGDLDHATGEALARKALERLK
jgi:hypothetical protein